MASIKIKTDGIFQRIPLLAKLALATDFILGGFKTGYMATETTTPVKLDGEGRAYVELVPTDTSALATKDEVTSGLATKANISDVYTQQAADDKFATKTSVYTRGEVYTKEETNAVVAGIVDSAPESLNTLNELAAALGDDANFSTKVLNLIGTKANSADVYPKTLTYTRTEIDNKVNAKANSSNVYTKAEIDNKIVNEIFVSSDGTAPSHGETIWIDLRG